MTNQFTRRDFIGSTALGLGLIACGGEAIGKPTMNDYELSVELVNTAAEGHHGELINRDFRAIFVNVIDEMKRLIPAGPPMGYKPMMIAHNPNGYPLCVINDLPQRYRILIATGKPTNAGISDDYSNRDYSRTVFQFAHELCHVYCDPRSTNWIAETFCEMSSQYMLGHMAELWSKNPPYANWRSYAPHFQSYLTYHLQKSREDWSALQAEHQAGTFRSALQAEQYQATASSRLESTILANQLLTFFSKRPQAWQALPYLGLAQDTIDLTSHDHNRWNASSRFQFSLWRKAVPARLRSYVMNIQKICETFFERL